MIITVKTLQQETYKIEVKSTDNVSKIILFNF